MWTFKSENEYLQWIKQDFSVLIHALSRNFMLDKGLKYLSPFFPTIFLSGGVIKEKYDFVICFTCYKHAIGRKSHPPKMFRRKYFTTKFEKIFKIVSTRLQ